MIPDITRALPRERLLPWLFEELSHVPPDHVTIVNGTGSHRANTEEELAAMVGQEVYERYRVVNHDAHDPATLEFVGKSHAGRDCYMNREYVEADRRIVMGFIEPHFMAGFSGGYKGIFPAVADVESIMDYHRASVIGHERSTWGVLEDNPTQDQIRANGSLLPAGLLRERDPQPRKGDHRLLLRRRPRGPRGAAARPTSSPPWSPANASTPSSLPPTAATPSTRTSTRPSRACPPPTR